MHIERISSNFTKVVVNGMTVWFSYATCVAFQTENMDVPVVHQNDWGVTTGKHLNMINPDKNIRVDRLSFQNLANNINNLVAAGF